MNQRVAFGLELRRIRERGGLTLEQVCEQTKVSAGHYAALEAGDLSRWPSGIFRRSFIRSYAAAVGLDPDQVLAQFNQVFPDPADGPRALAQIEAARREDDALASARELTLPREDFTAFRLALEPVDAEAGSSRFHEGWLRVVSAAVDLGLAAIPAALAAAVLGRGWFLPAAVLFGATGHLLYYGLRGSTPGSWITARLPRHLSSQLSRVRARTRRSGSEAAAPRQRVGRQWARRTPSHVHRVQH
jgi:transcriptional regulator with XRE-family HTH domain